MCGWAQIKAETEVQEDYPIAGGDGTGTPQEELTELTVELTDFDNGLAQKEDYPIAGGDLTGTP